MEKAKYKNLYMYVPTCVVTAANLIKYKHLLLQNEFCYPTKVMAAFSKMQCLLAVTKTRTGLELDWRWTRTYMFFNGFALFITFLTTRGGLT